jgi:EAL domain-containing protein (putative c-di-GMP-specific phosphodiesterase class I)
MAIEGHKLSVQASIGLAQVSPGELSAEEALRNADVAMYLAKDRGRGRVAVYEPSLHAEVLDRLALHADLQRAIAREQLVLHFQPTIELSTGTVVGFEALVRWNHPTRGLIPPGDFIPLAEQTGLIRPLGSWVLRHACQAAIELGAELPDGARPPSISVNVAAQQLAHHGLVAEVLRTLAETGLAPQRLTLEITESVLLHDVNAVIEQLSVLRRAGIRIAIDDFGTGYSSLSYLRKLPLDILKVDKAFIDRVTTDDNDAALTEAILAMSAAMHLTTVAEGVELRDQADWLAGARCRYGQGFLWSRPVPLADAIALLTVDGTDDSEFTTEIESWRTR